jgi:acetate kinase
MNILVINSGSSSIKFQLINMEDQSVMMKGMVDGIGLKTCKFIFNGTEENYCSKNHEKGMEKILSVIPRDKIHAIGHRVVHGGEKYRESVLINEDVKKTIKELFTLAPLHNPANLEGINACEKILKGIQQVAVFDTAFHSTIPKEAYLYGIPYSYYEKYAIRKYGFHGTSHRYIMLKTKEILKKKTPLNMISCHLGNGSSITAIKEDKSIDCSLGFTPTPGVLMGTRCGDIDPSIVTFIQRKERLNPDEIDNLLNKNSGFLGITGSPDMRQIHESADGGDTKCRLLLDMLAYDIAFYIGAYTQILGKVDAITFTGGIGQNAWYLREKVLSYFQDVKIDLTRNQTGDTCITKKESKLKVLVIPTNEELMIAKDTASLVKIVVPIKVPEITAK